MLVNKSILKFLQINLLFLFLLSGRFLVDFFPKSNFAISYSLFTVLVLIPLVGISGGLGWLLGIAITMSVLTGVFWMASKNNWKWWKTTLILFFYFFVVFTLNALRAEW